MKTTLPCSPGLQTNRRFRCVLMGMILAVLVGCNSIAGLTGSEAPVTCLQRRSLVGKGTVVIVVNSSKGALSLWLESGGKQTKFAVSSGSRKEFGFLEDYQFGDNSSFTIGGDGFSTKTYRVKDLAEQKQN